MQLRVRWEHGGLWGTEEKESPYQENGRDKAVEVALGACDQWEQVVHSGKQQEERHGNAKGQGVWNEQGLDASLGPSPPSSFLLPPPQQPQCPFRYQPSPGETVDGRGNLAAGNESAHPIDHRDWCRGRHMTETSLIRLKMD